MAISPCVGPARPNATRRMMSVVLACVLLAGISSLVVYNHQRPSPHCDPGRSVQLQATLPSPVFSSSTNRILTGQDQDQPNVLNRDGVVGSVSRSNFPDLATQSEVSVPHTIWQTARSREDTPELGTDLFNSWTTKNPGYDHYFMDDDDIEAFIAAHYNDTVLETFKEMPLGVMKADVFRYMLIHQYGGVWADMDTECLQPVRSWVPHGCFFAVALEGNDNYFCQWAFAAVPGHGILGSVLDLVLRKMINREYKNVKSDDGEFVHKLTGPSIWTDGILNYLGVDLETRGGLTDLYNERQEEWRKAGVCLLTEHEFVNVLFNKNGHWHPDLLKGSWRSWTMERDAMLNDIRQKEEEGDKKQGEEEQDDAAGEPEEEHSAEEEEQSEEEPQEEERSEEEGKSDEELQEEEQQEEERSDEERSEEKQQEEEQSEGGQQDGQQSEEGNSEEEQHEEERQEEERSGEERSEEKQQEEEQSEGGQQDEQQSEEGSSEEEQHEEERPKEEQPGEGQPEEEQREEDVPENEEQAEDVREEGQPEDQHED